MNNNRQVINPTEEYTKQKESGIDYLDRQWLNTPGDIEDFIFYFSEEKICEK